MGYGLWVLGFGLWVLGYFLGFCGMEGVFDIEIYTLLLEVIEFMI